MKKLLSILLTMTLVLSSNSMLTFAADSTLGDLYAIAEKHSSISGNVKQYTPFTVNGRRIQLFKETVLTADEAVKIYSNAYALISKPANEMGIDVSMDDPKFQEHAKTYVFLRERRTPLELYYAANRRIAIETKKCPFCFFQNIHIKPSH